MDYRIVEKSAFRVIGKAIQVTVKDGENLRKIPEFWQQCDEDGTIEALLAYGKGQNLLGMCTDMQPGEDHFTYLIAVEALSETAPNDFVARTVPASTWAVFPSVGPLPDAIQNVWKHIYQEWFPTSGYQHADGPELEVYMNGDTTAEDYRCEVWIPVMKK